MAFKQPQYPKELTDKWWQSHKGLVAKIATNDGTGIGRKLTALQTAFSKINWQPLNYDSFWPGTFGSRTDADIKQGLQQSAAVAKAVDPVYKMARDVENDAKKLMDEWSRSKVIPKASVVAVKTIMDQAKALSYAIAPGTIAEIAKIGAKENAEGTRLNREALQKKVASVPSKLDQIVRDTSAGVNMAQWDRFWAQDVRTVGTLLPHVLKAYPTADNAIKAFRKHSNKCNTPADQNQLNGWLREISAAATQIRQQMV